MTIQQVMNPRTGKMEEVFLSTEPDEARERGRMNATQDSCENNPFHCVGGLDSRPNIKAPFYIDESVAAEYLEGYTSVYGDDWATVKFTWRRALRL